MFRKLADFVIRFRLPIVVGWVALAAAMFLFAPSLSQKGQLDQSHFLPPNTESGKAGDLIAKYFPTSGSGGSGTLVFYDSRGLSEADYTFAKQVQGWLLSDQNKGAVKSVNSVFDSPELAARLVSPDKTTMLMNVGLTTSSSDSASSKTVDSIRSYVSSAPGGLEVYTSGAAGIYSDMFGSLKSSLDLTTLITVVLVVVLLLIIYRSPVASLVPLFTIGIAYLVSRGVLGLLAAAGISIWSQIDVFLIVLVFGAGTDYCLFMISRFREELKRNDTRLQATKATVTRISAVITASAFAVIIGLSGMAVARFEMIKTMGPVMAVAILITLLAALTLTPALTSLFGNKLFWPAHARVKNGNTETHNGFWSRVAKVTTGHPAIVAPVVIVLMAIPLLALPHLNRSFDQISELPVNSDSTRGFRVLQQHFSVGEMDPQTAIVIAPEGASISSPSGLANLVKLGNDIRATKGVAQVQSLVQPYGTAQIPQQFTVSGQLALMVPGSSGGSQGQASANVSSMAQGVARLGSYLTELSNGFGWVKQDSSFLAMVQAVKDAQTQLQAIAAGNLTAQQLGQALAQVQTALGSMSGKTADLAAKFKAQGDPLFIPSSISSDPQTAQAMHLFISSDGGAARIYVVTSDSPQSNEAMTAIKNVRQTVKNDLAAPGFESYQAGVAGSSASVSDMRTMLDSDFTKIQLVVLLGVFVVFVALLRSLVAPLYLLATVILSYATTLGMVTWIFQDLQGQDGVSFIVPIIVFVLLVALGADYNIFLMSRVREESGRRPSTEAIRIAAGVTGSVITACGLILAGTFGALISSPLRIMVQVGTAVGLGITIDTFVVRSLLVPAIATLVGRKNWWPSKFAALAGESEKETVKALPGEMSESR